MFERNFLFAAAAILALSATSAASAATFVYSYASSDGSEGASGTLDATANGDGTFTAISGTIAAFGIVTTGSGTLIANPSAPASAFSPSGFFIYDDQLLPSQNPSITSPGLLFNVGGAEVNIYSNGPGPATYEFQTNVGGVADFGNFALSELAVPEPATWALMIIGLGTAGVAVRRRNRTAKAQQSVT